ncbi:MAG TPA: STY0301 family protein [Candidatus Saccharimonadales bacterium]|jgi:hypothetical protein|nr:STY0301 family protein [Candidatus Saccharimonadales bacterium]
MKGHAAVNYVSSAIPVGRPMVTAKTGRWRLWLAVPLVVASFPLAGCHKTEIQHAGVCDCPTKIKSDQNLARSEPGWLQRYTHDSDVGWLTDISFFEGDPRKGGVELSPKKFKTTKDVSNWGQSWYFDRKGKDIWLACRYRLSTIRLLRKLADEVTECTGNFTEYSPGYPSVSCK